MDNMAIDPTTKENQVLFNEFKWFDVIKINQMPKSLNVTMKNEQKRVNVTMDVLEQAKEKK